MKKLLIKRQKLPARCEICHQKDLFYPMLNLCARCNGSSIQTAAVKPVATPSVQDDSGYTGFLDPFLIFLVVVITILGLVMICALSWGLLGAPSFGFAVIYLLSFIFVALFVIIAIVKFIVFANRSMQEYANRR